MPETSTAGVGMADTVARLLHARVGDDGTAFDPVAFDAFLHHQSDLGTKWAPRFVRVVTAMPLTASNKIKQDAAAPAAVEHYRPGVVATPTGRRLPPDDRGGPS